MSENGREACKETAVASVCVEGVPCTVASQNKQRIAILQNVVRQIKKAHWPEVDCILFPGGFFHLGVHIGHLTHLERVAELEKTDFGRACKEASAVLQDTCPGSLIIVGIDSIERLRPGEHRDGIDQLCVAWDDREIIGIGRKVFPTLAEQDGHVCYVSDFLSPHRIINLPSQRKAVLCSCYDMFGCKDVPENHKKQTAAIKYLDLNHRLIYRKGGIDNSIFRGIRKKCVDDWHKTIGDGVTVGLVAIHGDPNIYWQRHGIVPCSAALKGGLAVGAAHFSKNLPSSPDTSPLASAEAPKSVLTESYTRQSYRLKPKNWIETGNALVRLFVG